MRKTVAVALLLWSSLTVLADPPTLEIPPVVRPTGQYVQFLPKTNAVSVIYIGRDSRDPIPSGVLKDQRLFLLDTRGMVAGDWKFIAIGAGKTGEQIRTDFVVRIGSDPVPVPPTPPTPPTPPDPMPSPTPAPIPEAGLRVLIVEETKDRGSLPITQKEIILGKAVRDYLDSHCTKEQDGGAAYRIWDKDQSGTENDYKVWADALKRPRSSVPWVVISNGKAGFEGPLPKTADEFLSLVKKYEQ